MPDQTPEPLTDRPTYDELMAERNEAREQANAYLSRLDRAAEKLMDRSSRINGLELDLDQARAEAGLARGDAGALQARVVELRAQVAARDTRIAELEAELANARGWAGQENTRLRARVAELEAAQSEPHAYIAVKRRFSIHADQPEWEWDAAVIPAGDDHAWDRDDHKKRGYELLPIAGTETGTRPTTPQSDPAGYVVVTRNSEGGLHRSATAWDDLERATAAGDFQARHADGTGCTAAVYELREVRGDA